MKKNWIPAFAGMTTPAGGAHIVLLAMCAVFQMAGIGNNSRWMNGRRVEDRILPGSVARMPESIMYAPSAKNEAAKVRKPHATSIILQDARRNLSF